MAVLIVLGMAASAFGAPDPASLTGVVTAKDGKYFVTDESTRTTAEVRGEGLEKYVGAKVQIRGKSLTGVTPAPGATLVFAVSDITPVGVGAAAAGGGKAAAAGVKAGLSKAAITGIAAGATAGTVGALYATDVIGGDEEPVSRR